MERGDNYPNGAQPLEPLWRLAYRFFWPFQYFRDVTQGSLLERQQNYRYNRAMRVYLPGFMVKWVFLTALCFLTGSALVQFAAVVPAAGCYIVGCWTFIVVVLLGVDWVWLERFPELY